MPAIIYKNEAGKRVPSVTGIISMLGEGAKGLQYWYWKKGCDGLDFNEMPEADIGTIAHMMLDYDAKGKELDLSKFSSDQVAQARVSFENWQTWKDAYKPEIFATEVSLVSEKYQYGGTIDVVLNIGGNLAILDLKTGKDIYTSQIIQVCAGYHQLWNENFPGHPITGGTHLIRTGKELPMFVHHYYADFPLAWEMFERLLWIYDACKEIKKLK